MFVVVLAQAGLVVNVQAHRIVQLGIYPGTQVKAGASQIRRQGVELGEVGYRSKGGCHRGLSVGQLVGNCQVQAGGQFQTVFKASQLLGGNPAADFPTVVVKAVVSQVLIPGSGFRNKGGGGSGL